MRILKDNEIEVIGASLVKIPDAMEQPKPTTSTTTRKPWILVAILAAALAIGTIAVIVLWPKDDANEQIEETEITQAIPEPVPTEEIAETSVAPSGIISPIEDSINDVAFSIYPLIGLSAEVTFTKPDSLDQNISLATTAADVRADNGEIVCEFILDKQQLTRGTRKAGWCYISPWGEITLGIGAGNEAKNQALSEGGCFFRQLALVMDGEVMPNQLKGKAKRRALAFRGGMPVIVKSAERESIYDFSQALADYGFSHALYLPGGEGFWKLQSTNGDEYHAVDYPDSKYVNYLVFKKELSHSIPHKSPTIITQ